jgi:hypothetical protein
MKKETAAHIIEIARVHGTQLVELVHVAKEHAPPEEARAYARAAGKVVGYMLTEVLEPIFKEHPDLEPDEYKTS